jgi:branched-chain amino acid transport system permease protein
LPYWSTIPAAGLVCLGAGFLFGLPALRLEGLYLALATFALAVATPQILKYKGIEHWTGGVQGIVIVKPPAPFGLPISPDKWLYLFALAVAVVMFVLGVGILRGRVGRYQYATLRKLGDRPLVNINSDGARIHARLALDRKIAAERGIPRDQVVTAP